jgi:hypothetical protein
MAERNFIEVMQEALSAIAPGLQDAGTEMKAEMSRLGTQGAMELANALFNGSAFVPYGPGQYTPTPEMDQGRQEEPEPQIEHGGREM